MNIFKELALSIYSFKSYSKFLKNRKLKVFAFGILLTLITYTFTMLGPLAIDLIVDGGIGDYIEESIPDFELKDGILWAEEIVEYDYDDTYLYIDTDPFYVFGGADEMADFLYEDFYNYSTVALMDSEKIIAKYDGMVHELYYTDLEMDFSKDDLFAFVPIIYTIFALVFLFIYLFTVAGFFFGVLFVALFGKVAAACMKYQLTFGQLYLLGIYSRTLPLLLDLVLSFISISIPSLVSIGISVAVLVLVIKQMKKENFKEDHEIPVMDYSYEEIS